MRLTLIWFAIGGMAGVFPQEARTEEPAIIHKDRRIPEPFRVRDMTFPNLLVLGFVPGSSQGPGTHNWAFELNLSVANAFQISDGAEDWLALRGGPRGPLDRDDANRMIDETRGSQIYIDGEFGVADLGVHYGVSSRMTLAIRLSYLRFNGGFLDPVIYGFHDTFGLPQEGREFVDDGEFQILFLDDDGSYVLLDRPTSGGFTDPVLSLAYSFGDLSAAWSFGGEVAVKVPVANSDQMLSSGSPDLGIQISARRRWKQSALILNCGYVIPGEFVPSDQIDLPNLPSINAAYLHRIGRRTAVVVQGLASSNLFEETDESTLDGFGFQLTAGFKFDALGGRIGVAVTENLFDSDSAPDLGLHLTFGTVID